MDALMLAAEEVRSSPPPLVDRFFTDFGQRYHFARLCYPYCQPGFDRYTSMYAFVNSLPMSFSCRVRCRFIVASHRLLEKVTYRLQVLCTRGDGIIFLL